MIQVIIVGSILNVAIKVKKKEGTKSDGKTAEKSLSFYEEEISNAIYLVAQK